LRNPFNRIGTPAAINSAGTDPISVMSGTNDSATHADKPPTIARDAPIPIFSSQPRPNCRPPNRPPS